MDVRHGANSSSVECDNATARLSCRAYTKHLLIKLPLAGKLQDSIPIQFVSILFDIKKTILAQSQCYFFN